MVSRHLIHLGHLRLVLGSVRRQLVHLSRVTGQVNHHRGQGPVDLLGSGEVRDVHARAVVGPWWREEEAVCIHSSGKAATLADTEVVLLSDVVMSVI